MAKWKEGDRVRIVTRDVLAEDRRSQRYYDHMSGLVGTVTNVYGPEEVAVQVDIASIGNVPKDVHAEATSRMRKKFIENTSEEARNKMSKEELDFRSHYVLLVRSEDLEKAS